jgi:hypothetical protein
LKEGRYATSPFQSSFEEKEEGKKSVPKVSTVEKGKVYHSLHFLLVSTRSSSFPAEP